MYKNKKQKKLFLLLVSGILCSGFFCVSFAKADDTGNIPEDYNKKIELKDSLYKFTFNTKDHPEFFDVYSKYFYKGQEIRFASGSTIFNYLVYNFNLDERTIFGISRGGIRDYINKELISLYNIRSQNVRIYRNPETQKIEFDGMAIEGREIDVTKLENLIVEAILNTVDSIVIPFKIISPEVLVEDEELRTLGIKELIATGESDFSGSSWMRINNIRIGLSRFNGVIVPPEEVFSIGKYLGEVSGRTGYKRELVIKGDKTVPEYGGGLCQVSTTAFRGALLGGFEIIERLPHAYAVSYYSPYGTDATIYPPLKDFKFLNDTSSAILVQTVIDEPNKKAYFKYYGSKDTRQVSMFGPYLSNYRNPGATRYEVSSNLKPGERRLLGAYHQGFDAFWMRKVFFPPQKVTSSTGSIVSTGSTLIYNLFSRYQARPWFYQIGQAEESVE